MRPPFVALFGPFIAAGIAVVLLDGHRLSWLAGLATGMCIGAWIAVTGSLGACFFGRLRIGLLANGSSTNSHKRKAITSPCA